MVVNRHKFFRWTPRTARITFAYVVAFPALIGYLAYTTDVSMGLRCDLIIANQVGQMGYERKAERRYNRGILDGGMFEGSAVVLHKAVEAMNKHYKPI